MLFNRNVLNLKDADSTEMNAKTSAAVIDLMDTQKDVSEKGGTMRLGAYDCQLKKNKFYLFSSFGFS